MKNFAKSKGKRITAALLCAVMCIMSLPLSAFAFTAEERIVEEAMGKPIQKDGASHENPTVAKTDKNPPSRQSSAEVDGKSDKGISKSAEEKPSVREKLERYKAQAKTEKEADRTDLDKSGEKPKSQNRTNQTTHQQPKKKKNRNKNKAR